jgi:alanyl-tRNA synthetase
MRRLLRRAVRQGSMFGLKDPFLFKGVPVVATLFKDTAEDIGRRKDNIASTIKQEEERFLETIETGSEKLKSLVTQAKADKKKAISGQEAFRLYETYGFPPELTKEMLAENGMSFDEKEFAKVQQQAQDQAREGWKGSGARDVTIYNDVLKKAGASKFKGYETLNVTGPIKFLLKDGKPVELLRAGEAGEVITGETPFYPEGGGQVGDKGFIYSDKKELLAVVADAQKPVTDLIVHQINAKRDLAVGQSVTFSVDANHREPTKRHHTATHLLHAALRKVLGTTVAQAGSLVAPDRLRFDYTYNRPLTKEQIQTIENIVNDAVLHNWPVQYKTVSADLARKMGAMALFGEKYGNEVRCLIVSGHGWDAPEAAFSLELCGGTHVSASGDIGAVKIISDSSIASGVRRMEAVAGMETMGYLRTLEDQMQSAAEKLKSTPQEIDGKLTRLLEKQRQLEQEVRDLKLKLAQGGSTADNKKADVQTVNGFNLTVKVSDGLDAKELRVLADRLKDQLKSGVVFAATTVVDEDREKVSFVFAITPDVQAKGLHAGQLAKKVAELLGGSGGGRPDFAQGGGQSKAKLMGVLDQIPGLLGSL